MNRYVDCSMTALVLQTIEINFDSSCAHLVDGSIRRRFFLDSELKITLQQLSLYYCATRQDFWPVTQ